MTAQPTGTDVAVLAQRLANLTVDVKVEIDAVLQQVGDDVLAAARAQLADRSGPLAETLSAGFDPETSTLTITSTSPAAVFLEFGTRRRGARPFLRPAIAATRATSMQRMRDAMKRVAQRLKDVP